MQVLGRRLDIGTAAQELGSARLDLSRDADQRDIAIVDSR